MTVVAGLAWKNLTAETLIKPEEQERAASGSTASTCVNSLNGGGGDGDQTATRHDFVSGPYFGSQDAEVV